MKIITLLTDFGLQDGYVGVMKGVIWGIAPQVRFADLSHLVTPQNITEGALVLVRRPEAEVLPVPVDQAEWRTQRSARRSL